MPSTLRGSGAGGMSVADITLPPDVSRCHHPLAFRGRLSRAAGVSTHEVGQTRVVTLEDEPEPVPRFSRITTVILEGESGAQVALINGPLWPTAGSIVSLGPRQSRWGIQDAEVLETRLELPLTESATAGAGSARIVVVIKALGRTVGHQRSGWYTGGLGDHEEP